ncbi:MAG: alpha/beta hydrolase [Myxococcales bacterium]|nr:alpha/beta hydrolase [Myxococcales bacterium]
MKTDLRSAPVRFVDVGHARVAHRVVGSGPDVLFVHGWPLHGLTWRDVVAPLAAHYRCHVIDLPGAGLTKTTPSTRYGLESHAATLVSVIDALSLDRVALVGHDSGGAVARFAAASLATRVTATVIADSEIPGHKPLLLQLLLASASLPGGASMLRGMLGSRSIGRSILAWGACFHDVDRAEGEFRELFVEPLVRDDAAFAGQMQLTKTWDWSVLDRLRDAHAKIVAPSLLVWGERDPYFPAEKARAMAPQFGGETRFVCLQHARLFAHEEHPERFADEVSRFLDATVARQRPTQTSA